LTRQLIHRDEGQHQLCDLLEKQPALQIKQTNKQRSWLQQNNGPTTTTRKQSFGFLGLKEEQRLF